LENNGMTELITGAEAVITAEGDNLAIHAKAAAEMLFAALPAADGGTSGRASGELADPRFLGWLHAQVEVIWFARARERMSSAPHGDPLARWNAASGPALRGVEAHARRQAAEAYAEAVAELPEGPGRERLAELERLFALQWVARNSGDLLAAGHLTNDQVNALPEAVEQLIAAVAEHLPLLIESFALPDEVLADWPIAGADYVDAYDDPEASWHTTGAQGER
jgi:acyl-CoA oxidase